MPVTPGEYEVERNDDDGSFRVINTVTGDVHAAGTSKGNAEHQRRLLYAVGHGWRPTRDNR